MNDTERKKKLEKIGKSLLSQKIPICPCNEKKHPFLRGGFKDVTLKEEKLKKWFNNPKVYFWASRTVPYFVVDIDGPNLGSIKQSWLNKTSYRQKSFSGGTHYFFKNPDGSIKNCDRITGDVDIKGSNGCITHYMPIFSKEMPVEGIPPAPKELLKFIANNGNKTKRRETHWSITKTLGPKGVRNSNLFRYACIEFQFNNGKAIPSLIEIAKKDKLDNTEIKTAIESAKKRAERQIQSYEDLVTGNAEIDSDHLKVFVMESVEKCVKARVRTEMIGPFLSALVREKFENGKAKGELVCKMVKKMKLEKEGFIRPYVIPNEDLAEEFKRAFRALGIEGRINIRGGEAQYNKNEKGWKVWTDAMRMLTFADIGSWTLGGNCIRIMGENKLVLKKRFKAIGSKGLTPGVFNSYGRARIFEANEFDPFLDFLNKLPNWDKKPRLRELISSCFNLSDKDKKLSEWIGESLFVAMVKRTLEPACKWDYMFILQGDQGIGKSSFFNYFFPREMEEECFSDQSPFGKDEKRNMDKLKYVLIESAELAGFHKARLEELKAFITRRWDRGREIWGKEAKHIPRRFVLVGSVNDDTFLPDEAENRRFIVLRVMKKCLTKSESYLNIQKYLKENRNQLWAEAKELWYKEYKLVQPEELEERISDIRETHRIKNTALEQEISDLAIPFIEGNVEVGDSGNTFIKTELFEGKHCFRISDLIRVLSEKFKVSDNKYRQIEISNFLKELGFNKHRRMIKGTQATRWYYGEENEEEK